ncbi:protein containing diguanylate cyclase (GGDEF) domain [Bellilinea caldifistulae]|uniref:diguanylate cyclase n=1 Tax=Bellilinea caldifistulae TaxID=360411 RepID=UPI0007808DA6|nr:diguanylate cyclase [Bellilinea caldifistulae]GAP09802.1 protein containing diguanylate cyclase (GGDEF) domain [Bellilinea caldifistulae]
MADSSNTNDSTNLTPNKARLSRLIQPSSRWGMVYQDSRHNRRSRYLLRLNRKLRRELSRLQNGNGHPTETDLIFRQNFLALPDPILIWRRDEQGEIRLMLFNQAAVEMSLGRIKDFTGITVEDFFSHEPQVSEIIYQVFRTGKPKRIETLTRLRTTGEEKWVQADYVRLSHRYLLNIIRDITHQKLKQQAEEEQRSKIELLRQAMTAFTSVLNLRQVLSQVMEYLKMLIPYDRAFLFLADKDELEIAAAAGFANNDDYIGRRISARNPQFEAINRNRYPLYLDDAELYRPFQELGDLNCGKAWLGIPMLGHGQVIGYLSIYNANSSVYGGNEAELGQTFANQAAIAIENARLFQQVQQYAITDGLTGFYNRRYFYELAEIEMRRSQRYGGDLSLVMIDIDLFKNVNDRLGHTAGDQVLMRLSQCLRSQIRASDSIGRYGGEEFVILLPETNVQNALEVAERLRRSAEECTTFVGHTAIQVTISLGVAQMDEDCLNVDDLFHRADRALYLAKQNGRNRVCAWQAYLRQ